MAKNFDKQFKIDAVNYYLTHKELGLKGYGENLGVHHQTLARWKRELVKTGDIQGRGSGNYSSNEAKEIARLQRKLRDTKDALDVGFNLL